MKRELFLTAAILTTITAGVNVGNVNADSLVQGTTTGTNAIAIGTGSIANGASTIAVGDNASASEAESLAIGKSANATSSRSLAIGANAKATGARAVAVGSGAGNSGLLGFASGINSSGSVTYAYKTINYATTAEGDNAVALGYYANAKHTGVAVGQNALAATGGVAIGKGVFEDTNNDLAGGVAIGQDSASTGVYSLAMGRHAFATGSTSMAVGYEAIASGNFAVAIGRNVSATGTSTAIGRNATATNGGLAIGSQDNDASTDKTTASAKGAVAIGKNTTASSKDAVAIGTDAQANKQGAVALGSGSTTETLATKVSSIAINGVNYDFAGATDDPNMQVSVGSASATRQIKNVAAGEVSATSTDAINGSQLNAVINSLNFPTVVDGKNTTVSETVNINGGKEYQVNLNDNINLTNNGSVTIGDTEIKNGEIVVGDKNDVHTSMTSGQLGVDGPDGATAIMSAAISLENKVDGSSATVETKGLTAVDANGRHVAFTTNGIDVGNQVISNVADGVKDTDAATVGQLKASISTESVVADSQSDNIATVSVTNGKSTGDANAQYGVYVSRTTVDSIAKASNRFAGDNVIKVERWSAPSNVADLTTFKFDGNEAAKVLPISYKANDGTTNTVTAEEGFNFVDGSHIKASTDANGVVRFDLDQNIPDQINSNTNAISDINSRYNNLVNKVDNNYKTTERGIAGTAALAALHPLDFDPDNKLDVMAGYGHFHGSNSVALGAAYRPNEDLMFTVGSTVGNGDTVVNAGISYKVGAKSNMSRSKVSVAKDVADMKREMEAIKAQNAKITAILNAVLGTDLPEDQTNMFPDVPANHWAYEAVNDMAKRGLVIGYEDGQFKGDRTMTRYEFAMIVDRAIQKAKELNTSIDGRLVDEFKPELLRFEIEKNGSLERVHTLKSNKGIQRDSYGTIITK